MNDYERVARIIRFLDENHPEQPSLAEIARAAGLSESHLHRLFRAWAGVTPKDFVQCLTLEHAKRRLRESASILDAAVDAGFSGPGRLHDLFVTIEAVAPGEVKNGGAGGEIGWGYADSPFGRCSIGWSARGICHLAFHDDEMDDLPSELKRNWPNATFKGSETEAARWARSIFEPGTSSNAPLKAWVRGTA